MFVPVSAHSDSYQVKTMEAPRDAFDETRHRDGYVLSELPIKYPEFVVERFIPRPLANAWTFIPRSQKQRERADVLGS